MLARPDTVPAAETAPPEASIVGAWAPEDVACETPEMLAFFLPGGEYVALKNNQFYLGTWAREGDDYILGTNIRLQWLSRGTLEHDGSYWRDALDDLPEERRSGMLRVIDNDHLSVWNNSEGPVTLVRCSADAQPFPLPVAGHSIRDWF